MLNFAREIQGFLNLNVRAQFRHHGIEYRRELADFTIQVIDVAGGEKIPRKGGPGITQSDLLVINKTDLAIAVGADLAVMERDSKRMRGEGPFVFAQVKNGVGVDVIIEHILHAWQHATGVSHHHH